MRWGPFRIKRNFGVPIVVISEEAEPLGTKKSKNSFSQKIVKIGNLFWDNLVLIETNVSSDEIAHFDVTSKWTPLHTSKFLRQKRNFGCPALYFLAFPNKATFVEKKTHTPALVKKIDKLRAGHLKFFVRGTEQLYVLLRKSRQLQNCAWT